MIFYKYGNMLLFIFVVLLLFASSWHVYIWSDFFSKHIVYTFFIIVISALVIWITAKKFNQLIRENTLKNILNDMNSYKNPEIALRLNISINTVKSVKANAYRLLRLQLKNVVVSLLILAAFYI